MTAPWILHEDEHLYAVNKPAGVNTHSPDERAQGGLHEWLSAVAGQPLSIHHRLDKGTSGVLVFGKTQAADQRLAAEFAERRLTKRYLLLCAHDPGRPARQVCNASVRGSKRRKDELKDAETTFEVLEQTERWDLLEARPSTGRTHQVRLHAARLGGPILGDVEYAGAPAARLFLHAQALELDGGPRLEAPLPQSFRDVLGGRPPGDPGVAAQAALEAREVLFDPVETDAFLWIDREHDGFPEVRVERLGSVGLVLRYDEAKELPRSWLDAMARVGQLSALVMQRRPRKGKRGSFYVVRGELAETRFEVRELGLRYLVDLGPQGTSSGFFLDQRETRRRLLSDDLTGQTLLNAFAHTGSLSVAAAKAGAETLTLDLSKNYLDWARENMSLNGLDPAAHDFIYGDALDWMRRLAKKGRRFDHVLIDPPSFAAGRGRRKTKTWSVERDLGELVGLAAGLVAPGGRLLVSTNLRRMTWERFTQPIQEGLRGAGRKASVEHASVPLDHRSGPGDPPYLKLAWLRLD